MYTDTSLNLFTVLSTYLLLSTTTKIVANFGDFSHPKTSANFVLRFSLRFVQKVDRLLSEIHKESRMFTKIECRKSEEIREKLDKG